MISRLRTRVGVRVGARSDDGAMLIFALIIITTVALVTGALLTTSGAKFAATVQLRQVAGNAYASDAAAKIAINALEQGNLATGDVSMPSGFITSDRPSWVFNNNVDDLGCFGGTGEAKAPVAKTALTLPSVYRDAQSGSNLTATVTCAPVIGTGIFDSGPTNPIAGGAGGSGGGGGGGGGGAGGGAGRALTVLGPGSPALDLKVLGSGGNNQFAIHGDIGVQGQLAVSNGNVYTNGKVEAGSCNPASAVIADMGVNCSAGAPGDPHAARVPDISSVPGTLGSWSGCAGGVRTFTPGYYNDADALTKATNGCARDVFTPGTYYFDFHNNSNDPTFSKPAMSTGSTGSGSSYDQWTINGPTVVGGTDTGGSVPGACKNPIDNKGVSGVQFVFGGDSHLYVTGTSKVELCASSNATQAPIAVFGLDGASAARGALAAGYATAVSQTNGSLAASSSGAAAFVPTTGTLTAAVATAGDGNTATYTHTASSSDTAVLALTGLAPGTAIPQGSTLKSAILKVWHSEVPGTGGGNTISPSLQIDAPGSAGPVDTSAQPTVRASAATSEDIDVTADLAPMVNAGNLGATRLLFGQKAKNSAVGTVDKVSLVLSYYEPRLREQTTTTIPSNCVAKTTTGAGHCDVIAGSSGSSFAGSFVVQGVVYIPGATINLQLGNGADVISLRWGLVAWRAYLQSQNSFAFAYPVVSIPNTGGFGAANTAVDLKVFLCSGAGPCSTTGTPALTSRVKLTDPVDASGLVAPEPGKRKVEVMSWAEQR